VREALATEVRRATPADAGALTEMLARAFLDDPVAAWTCRPLARRRRLLEAMYAIRLRRLLAEHEVWTTPERSGAALWAMPGRRQSRLADDAAIAPRLLAPAILARLPLVAAGLAGMRRRHPRAAHWYLSLLGTDPDSRGRGIGSALLAPVLERCDRERVGAYLESSKERNVGFYARHGFRVVDELRLPRGPRMWLMWRDPDDPRR
jgi:GNAT superfamily N-acetyltransferase